MQGNSRVPQGCIEDPTLWYILCDGLLRIKLFGGVNIVEFADNIALIMSGKESKTLCVYHTYSAKNRVNWKGKVAEGLEEKSSSPQYE